MSDRIHVRGIRASGRHGALAGERTHRQPFVVDVDLQCDLRDAIAADDLTKTIDYALVAAEVRRVVEDTSFALVESLAHAIANCLLELGAARARVRVGKPAAALTVGADEVAVEVERSRS